MNFLTKLYTIIFAQKSKQLNIKKHIVLIENFISFSLFKVIDALIPLIIIPYLINVVGKDNYGIYAFAYALVFYLLNIVQYGFSLSAVRLIAVNRDNKEKINKKQKPCSCKKHKWYKMYPTPIGFNQNIFLGKYISDITR